MESRLPAMCFRFKPEDLDAMVSFGSARTRVRPKQ